VVLTLAILGAVAACSSSSSGGTPMPSAGGTPSAGASAATTPAPDAASFHREANALCESSLRYSKAHRIPADNIALKKLTRHQFTELTNQLRDSPFLRNYRALIAVEPPSGLTTKWTAVHQQLLVLYQAVVAYHRAYETRRSSAISKAGLEVGAASSNISPALAEAGFDAATPCYQWLGIG
jgi:hypothetical protein